MSKMSAARELDNEMTEKQVGLPAESPTRIANPPAAGIAVYAGIFFTSASVLLLELALTRVFAVVLWAHLAFMVVGTALFGFGLSGVYLALRQKRHSDDPRARLARLSLALAAFSLCCYLVIINVPFRMWNFSEDPLNFLYLGIWYIALIVPFFIAGIIIATILGSYQAECSKLYGVDLIGAASGSLLLIPLISRFGAEGTIVGACLLAILGGLFYSTRKQLWFRLSLVLSSVLLFLLINKADEVLPIKIHEQKRRFNTAAENNHIQQTRWSPISRVDIAYHRAGVFDLWIDGGTNESAILQWSGDMEKLTPQTWSTIGASFDLKQGSDPRVMIIGPAGGKEVLFALSYGASHVDAVEMDPSIVAIVNEPKYADYMGRLYQNEKVTLYNDEGRSFVRRQPKGHYDIIQSVNNYTPVAMNAGALNLSAAFLLTKEAFHDYLDHLSPDGVLALHRGTTLRVAIMALEVLAERGIEDPKSHILIFSGEVPYFEGFFMKNSPWTKQEVDKITDYLHNRPLQDPNTFLWNPVNPRTDGLMARVMNTPPAELNQYYSSLGVRLAPPTDNKPFMEHFLKFGKEKISEELPHEFHFRNNQKWRGIIPRGDFPYLAILAESALLALLFVALPLVVFARKSSKNPAFLGFLGYFATLGFGFIVVEICLMKRYVLFLGNPAYSITTVLVALLFGAGLGSLCSESFFKIPPAKKLSIVIPLLILTLLAETLFAPMVFEQFLSLTFYGRIAVASLLLLPLGFFMGMPFPLGLSLINERSNSEMERRQMTAWAWGMNGYFTVIGSASTVFIAVFAGFKAALLAAVAVYALGLLLLLRLVRNPVK